ncbi:hypothetical protein BDR26DRAFT_918657 [Obelidium mucronatum]|nr:hypothetical protein BDR26DRAFT_918657 [Obelidium mucronatum]
MGAVLCLPESDVQQQPPVEINVSLQNAPPKPEELHLLKTVNSILSSSNHYIKSLEQYKGCGDAIRVAISRPSPQAEEAVWAALVPTILQLKLYYEYSLQLNDIFPKLLSFLSNSANKKTIEAMETYQATTKRLADVLYFASVFDEIKIANPNIQNEFSYYRRALQKVRMNGNQPQMPGAPREFARMVVDDTTANNMSMFYAQPSPILKTLIDCCLKMQKGTSRESTLEILALLGAVCYNVVVKKQVQGQMIEYSLRVLVMCIVLYDHISLSEGGAFGKSSQVDIKTYIKLIQVHGGSRSTGLISGIRYSTAHLNDDATPSGIRDFVNEQ